MVVWTADCARVVAEVSSASPASPDPVWVDITPYVLGGDRGAPIEIWTGRQDATSQTQPSRMSLSLNNADNRFTPHNPLSVYYPWWEQGRRIRVRETLGPVTFDLFDGFIEQPQVIVRPPDTVDNVLTLTAIDRLGRLERARKFISVLTETNLAAAPDALRCYYPLNDVGPLVAAAGPRQPTLLAERNFGSERFATPDLFTFAEVDGPPGDDARYPQFLTHFDGLGNVDGSIGINGQFGKTLTSTITLSGTDVLTFVCWVKLSPSAGTTDQLALFCQGGAESTAGAFDFRRHNGVDGNWRITVTFDFVNFLNLDGPLAAKDVWVHLVARLRLSPNTQELWVNGVKVTGAVPGSPPATSTFSKVTIGTPWYGSIAHAQIYLTAGTSDYTDAIDEAQREVALAGLHRQRVDERIRTIFDYAGVTDAEMQLQDSPAVMQAARFAGRSPMDLVREAVATDGGVLLTQGPEIVFQSRKHRYNI